MDFIGVALAGMGEPLARILLEEVEEQGGRPQASMFRTGKKASLSQAALANGTAGHALDYDDVNSGCNGHPTAPVAPAVMALAEHMGSSGRDVIRALASGIDAECLAVSYTGRSPYKRGWHATGTVGCFGAAAASAQLLELDANTTAQAFGIAGTQAAALKAVFGTMTEPLHAGRAAATGVTAARLAKRGFASRSDILEAPQGFGATQSDAVGGRVFAIGTPPPQRIHVSTTAGQLHGVSRITSALLKPTSRGQDREDFGSHRPSVMYSVALRLSKTITI